MIDQSLSDESLVERVKEHDHQAFSLLVERHHMMFYKAAYRMVLNVEEAEDVVQESFLKLWQKPSIWKAGKGAKFTSWFYKIVINVAIDKRRKSGSSYAVDNVDVYQAGDSDQEASLAEKQQQRQLENAMKALPDRQLAALILCFYEGVSNKEAAAILGVGLKALESLIMRAKAGIKEQLQEQEILNKETVHG